MKLSTERKLLDETLRKVNECRRKIRHDPMLSLSLENTDRDLTDRLRRIDEAIIAQGGFLEHLKNLFS